jgi:tetratricopeptide (TPR) repeat protein
MIHNIDEHQEMITSLNNLNTDFENGKHTKIIKHSEDYLRKYPDEISFYVLISLSYSAKKKFSDALKILKRAEEKFHSHFDLFYQIAAVYSDLDKAEEAEKYYRKSIDATPPEFELSKADCWNDIGALKSNQGLEDEAKEYFKRALEIDPDHANALDNLYGLDNGDFEENEIFGSPIANSYDKDYELFHFIQHRIYLKANNRNKFKSKAEEENINMHILNAWTNNVAGEIQLSKTLTEDQKAEWYNSIEIDFSGEPERVEMPAINDPLNKEFIEIFSFLPPNGLALLMIALPFLRAVGISEYDFVVIRDEKEITAENKEMFIWAYEIGDKLFRLSDSKSEKEFGKRYNEILSIVSRKLSKDKAEEILRKRIEGLAGI